jgi:hypothetical protein
MAKITPEAQTAALKLAKILLKRSVSHQTGYGFAQTWDARECGLVEGDQRQWIITPLGMEILMAKLEDQNEEQSGFPGSDPAA